MPGLPKHSVQELNVGTVELYPLACHVFQQKNTFLCPLSDHGTVVDPCRRIRLDGVNE